MFFTSMAASDETEVLLVTTLTYIKLWKKTGELFDTQ